MTNTASISGWIKRLDNGTEVVRDALSESVTFTEYVEHYETLAADAADVTINFGGVTNAKLIIIKPEADKPVTINLNGDDFDIPIDKFGVFTGNSTQTITAMTMSNKDASNTNTVEIRIYG